MPKQLGIIGAGQLAQMTAIALQKYRAGLDLELTIQASSGEDIANPYADRLIVGHDYRQLLTTCEVITFENEFVETARLRTISDQTREPLFLPSLSLMAILTDKYLQRQHLQSYGLPVPRFLPVYDRDNLITSAYQLGFPCVLKARRHGYDGKGTWIIKSLPQLLTAWQTMGQVPAILEEFMGFSHELAVMIVKDYTHTVFYPVVQTIQQQQICTQVIAPAPVSPSLLTQAQTVSAKVADSLSSPGIYGLELFAVPDRGIVINEIAPRPHNSGHYTIEGCNVSQFDQLLRLVVGLPLISPQMQSPVAVMFNLLGLENSANNYQSQRQQIAQLPNTHVHWYGKSRSQIGRKLGHVTVLGSDLSEILATGQIIDVLWKEQN